MVASPDQVICELAVASGAEAAQVEGGDAICGWIGPAVDDAATVVHVHGSQVFADPGIIDQLVKTYLDTSAHMVTTGKPEGFKASVFGRFMLNQGLKRVNQMMGDPVALVKAPEFGARVAQYRAGISPYRFSLVLPSDLPFLRFCVESAGPYASASQYIKVAEKPEAKIVAVLDEQVTPALIALEVK